MRTLDQKLTKDIFNEFALSNEEMIIIRGGDGDPTPPIKPPEKI
jgi:hypothetical protein